MKLENRTTAENICKRIDNIDLLLRRVEEGINLYVGPEGNCSKLQLDPPYFDFLKRRIQEDLLRERKTLVKDLEAL